MGTVNLQTQYGPINVEIAGEKPTLKEFFAIDQIKNNPKPYIAEDLLAEYETKSKGFDVGFDTTTGIQDGKLRRMLGRADTPEDEEKVLREGFGLTEDQYTRDSRGRLALTPQGAQMFGLETDKPVLVDETGFSKNDFSDLTGLGTVIGGGVTGAIAGTAVGGPIGGIIGAALGGGSGKAIEEGTESLQGVQAQESGEILKDIGKEALIAGAGEGIVAGVAKVFRVASGTGRVGAKLPEEKVEDILNAATFRGREEGKGYMASLNAIGAPSLVARQQAISEKALGTSARLRQNHQNIMEDLSWLRGTGDGSDVDVQAVAESLRSAAESGNNALSVAAKNSEKQLLNHMENIANNLGRAATKDVDIDQNLFNIFKDSYKSFDDAVEVKFERIDAALRNVAGDAKIFNTKGISDEAFRFGQKYKNAGAGTSQQKAYQALMDIAALGEKASFGQLYVARKSLRDMHMMNIRSDTMKTVEETFMHQLDNMLGAASVDGAVNTLQRGPRGQFVRGLTRDQKQLLKDASADLVNARNFYKAGNKNFEKINDAISKKDLINAVRNDDVINPAGLMNSLVRNDNAKLLKEAGEAIDANIGAGTFAPIREQIAAQWLRTNLNKSMNTTSGKFSASRFKEKVDALGSTADELFGANADEVRRLAEQLNVLSLKNIDESVIKNFTDAGADLPAIGLLKDLRKKSSELATFQRNTINKKLADGNLTDTEAANFISDSAMRAEDVKTLFNILRAQPDGAAQIARIQTKYMDDLIGDFDKTFLTDKNQFAKFGDRLAKNEAKLIEIYGPDTAADMKQFGKIMKLLGESASGGDLVAANIAANPLENLGTVARLSVVGRVFSSGPFYNSFLKKYKAQGAGADLRTRRQIAGELMADAFRGVIVQGIPQTIDEGITTATNQATALLGNQMEKMNTPAPKPQTRTSVPDVQPGSLPEPQMIPGQQPSLRERAAQNPAAAATLLGGLGSAGLL
jgi:hypothetical protein